MYWAFSSLFWNIQEQNKNQEQDKFQIEQQKEIKKEVKEYNHWDIFKYWWKDDLFWHHNWTWLDEKYWFNWISYDQVRDLENVDEIDVDKAFPKYVSLDLKDKETFNEYEFEWKKMPYYEISWWNKFLLIFVHWLNWNATWWFKDWTFWWNFNRLKHIVYHNWWTYISPTIKWFSYWAKQLWSLINEYKSKNKDMKIYVACWSSWWETCWKMYDTLEIPLDWMILVWSMPPLYWIQSALKRNIPIYYWHWEKDKSMPLWWAISTYRNLRKSWKTIKLEVFTNWVHWTPIRMIDWLKTLRWIAWEENVIWEDKWKNVKDAETFKWIKEVYPNWVNLKTV